ncbi:hypothetical protein [Pseudonocardia sp. HH130630-07]|uniref:hypothetical protein n=1 Tax=Pseudonocardia sp. HH130630-07 TaxID=1690815 RepID=UPI0008152C22|nr:hypothetical protein [Pseudonocardia sp. HH130630-07]ANY05308.1 hypothetical protein AFB00_02135 [Pseudonocardia sp. HH130630-07]
MNAAADAVPTTSGHGSTGRRRGSIRQRGDSLQVRVFAGQDPVTGKDRYLTETVRGTDKPARKRAEKAMTRLQAEVDRQRSPESALSLSRVLDEWLRTVEIEDTTRRTYLGYIERTVKPAIGTIGIDKLSARNLETFYAQLRRCRARLLGAAAHRAARDRPAARLRHG